MKARPDVPVVYRTDVILFFQKATLSDDWCFLDSKRFFYCYFYRTGVVVVQCNNDSTKCSIHMNVHLNHQLSYSVIVKIVILTFHGVTDFLSACGDWSFLFLARPLPLIKTYFAELSLSLSLGWYPCIIFPLVGSHRMTLCASNRNVCGSLLGVARVR